MKQNIFTSLVVFAFAIMGLAACKKDITKPQNDPAYFELVLNGLAITANPVQELQVTISVANANNEPVYTNKKIKLLQQNGQFKTEKLNGQPATYVLTSLVISKADGTTLYAAPKTGSAKATQVQQALLQSFTLIAGTTHAIPVEVLPVAAGDLAEAFGYPVGSFNNPPVPADEVYSIKVKTAITIGQLVYDQVPAILQVTAFKNDQSTVVSEVSLQPGESVVKLPREFVKYQLRISKWGVTDEVTLLAGEIQNEMLVTLGGSKAAKKLLQEDKFLLVQGNYQPDGKNIYTYNPDGSLRQVDYYNKKPQSADLQLTITDKFIYGAGKLQRIDRYDGTNIHTGYTDFIYNAAGKIINMSNKSYDQETHVVAEYKTNAGIATIGLDYLFHNGHAMSYSMQFKNGNLVTDNALSSTGGGEGGTYKYDYNINPFAHINYPDLFLKNLSRNNLVESNKNYGGNIPMVVPFQYEYMYDTNGYPTVSEISYKGFTSGAFLYKRKTVFTYAP